MKKYLLIILLLTLCKYSEAQIKKNLGHDFIEKKLNVIKEYFDNKNKVNPVIIAESISFLTNLT